MIITKKKPVSIIESKKQNINDSNGSEKDDHVSNYVSFQVTTKKLVDTITTDVATKKMTATISDDITICENSDPKVCEDSNSDKSNENELSTKDIQKAYQEMYDNWIKVCNMNKSLKDKLF